MNDFFTMGSDPIVFKLRFIQVRTPHSHIFYMIYMFYTAINPASLHDLHVLHGHQPRLST